MSIDGFKDMLGRHGLRLNRGSLKTLQVNVGRKCNQACRHCHVDAGPWRTETMPASVGSRVCEWIDHHRPEVVDLTGGAPELSDCFKMLVETAVAAGSRVLDRCNLTILQETGFEGLPEYLASRHVEVIASLPCYSAENVRRQRGAGVFERSIAALQTLNTFGYGTQLPLHLVYNPVGALLPAPQAELEADYKAELFSKYGIVFNRLYTITNQPISRFAEDLRRGGQYEEYMELLVRSFNPATVCNLMCRETLSVDWQGQVYDCDFNQMLNLALRNGTPLFLWDVTPERLAAVPITTGKHCFACTAGCGSSCTGALS